MVHTSTGLKNLLLGSMPLKLVFDAGSEIRFYSGPVPASADAAPGTLLVKVKNGSNGVTFDATPVSGVLSKNPAEVWSGTIIASGEATHYRHVLLADNDAASTTAPRYQGSVGKVGADMNVANTNLIVGGTQPVENHNVQVG